MKRSFILLACVLACTLPGFAQGNILTNGNGSFELPVVPVGGYTVFYPGPGIPGWTVVGNSGTNVFIGSTTLCDAGPPKVCYPACHGVQWLDLTGAGSNDDSEVVAQTVATYAGEYYQLSYCVGNVGIGGPYGTASTVKVYIDATPPFSDTNSTISTADSSGTYYMVWQQFIHVFQATGPATTIKFLNGDPPTDGINGLDNVVLLHLCTSCKPAPKPCATCDPQKPTKDEAESASCRD
jgi:hypothetical protein